MCEFCKKFDFGSAYAHVDRYGSTIMLAGGSYRFPKEQQFNFCPVCGTSQVNIEQEKMKEGV